MRTTLFNNAYFLMPALSRSHCGWPVMVA